MSRLLVCSAVLVFAVAATVVLPAAPQITVASGNDLQRALDAARPGDTILLEPGVTYRGSFVLRASDRDPTDTRPIVVRTAGPEAVPAGRRISPQAASRLAKIQSGDVTPALRTAPRARFWRIELVEFLSNRDGFGDIITLGDGSSAQRVREDVPTDLVLDRVYVHGDPVAGQKRGIALNSARTTITNSYISEMKAVAADSQAIAGWNGPGDYLIENNYLEAAGENFILGGSDPAILGLTTTRVVVRGNTFSRPVEWRGSRWQVKNLFELKNARDVVIERNVFERNWQAAQSGYAILFTVRNQDGGCPWCQVEQVEFRQNVIRDVAAGVSILGIDPNHPSRQTNAIVLRDNLFDGIDSRAWGGNGTLLQMTDTPRNITLDHNTIIQGTSNAVIQVDGRVDGFVFTNNVASHGTYGIIASNHGVGNDSIRFSFAGGDVQRNVLAGGESRLYPPNNFFPTIQEFRRQFVDFDGRDFRVLPASPWMRAGTDGRVLGASLFSLPASPRPEPRPRLPIADE